MTILLDLVPSLKRQVAIPGEFDTAFPNTMDSDLIGSLGDAFGQAQLDGFFGTMVWDPVANTVTPDLSPGGSAIVGLYAAEGILLAKFRNQPTRTVYKAGITAYEVDYSANVLAAEIKELQASSPESGPAGDASVACVFAVDLRHGRLHLSLVRLPAVVRRHRHEQLRLLGLRAHRPVVIWPTRPRSRTSMPVRFVRVFDWQCRSACQ